MKFAAGESIRWRTEKRRNHPNKKPKEKCQGSAEKMTDFQLENGASFFVRR